MFACIHSVQAQPSLFGTHPERENPEHKRLVECAYSFSPRVEETAPHIAVVDLQGCAQLFGTGHDIAAKILARAGELGLRVNVVLAANPDAAICAARGMAGATVIEPGREREALAPLPLSVLDPSPEIAEPLAAWGIRTLGQLAALPASGLSERLGAEGLRLLELARGASPRALVAAIPPPGFQREMELDYPVALLEPLLFVLASLLNQLCRNLEEHALATNEITVRLKLETQSEHERVLRLPVPMLDNKAFLRLLQLDLESHPPAAPVVAVWLRTRPARRRSLQEGLFVPLAPEPQKLELTLARITKLVGEERAGSPELVDTHRPDAFGMKKFAPFLGARASLPAIPRSQGLSPRKKVQGPRSKVQSRKQERRESLRGTTLAFRYFRPPLPVEVETVQEWPSRITVRGVRGRVAVLAGPWRSSGDWWSERHWSRDEWDVATSDGALYRIYFDHVANGWFVEGSYD